MKILAQVVDDVDGLTRPAKMVAVMLGRFGELDPTLTLRMISLLYKKPVDVLAEFLHDDDGELIFQMIVSGFAVNSLADLIEATYLLGFARKSDG